MQNSEDKVQSGLVLLKEARVGQYQISNKSVDGRTGEVFLATKLISMAAMPYYANFRKMKEQKIYCQLWVYAVEMSFVNQS